MSAEQLFAKLAPEYEEHFEAPHRRAYDDLAWELTLAALPAAPGTVVDVGCGVGRWARRFLGLGYDVVGVEPVAEMAARAETVPGLRVLRGSVQDMVLGPVDAVIAMGSIQYTPDPAAAIARMAGWLKPGGVLAVLMDSRVALGVELLQTGKEAEALERLDTRRGLWRLDGMSAELHLVDRSTLTGAVLAAGLELVGVHGLLVGASVWGRDELAARLRADYPAQLAVERALAAREDLVDLGKQLLVIARNPAR
jgi:SAM-dependent methyltransferase